MGTLKPKGSSAYSYLKDDPFKLGCIQCKQTMHSVSFSFQPEICISLNTTNDVGNLFTIANCINYSYRDNRVYCEKCNSGYYLVIDKKSCVPDSIINCEIYEITSSG